MTGTKTKQIEEKTNTEKSPAPENEEKKSLDVERTEGNDTREAEILDEMPTELRSRIKTFMSMTGFSGTSQHPVASKITESHIEKIIDISAKDDERKYRDAQRARIFHLVYFLIGISVFIFLTLFLVGKKDDLYMDIINILVILAGGLGAGYGLKSYKDKEK